MILLLKKDINMVLWLLILTKKIINIINSRECEDVTNELNKYPNIWSASRDGSWSYNKAINDSKATINK